MSPPFRPKEHQASLWAGLQAGSLQVVATDHCTFTREQKRLGLNDFRMIPNGTGGIQDRMPLLWTFGVNAGRLTKEEFVAVTSANIARILNIYPRKGAVAVGSDADLVVADPAATKTISAKKQLSRIDYNVFEGITCTGVPHLTLSRGRIAWREGELRAEKGDGQFIARPPFPAVHVANSTWKEILRSEASLTGLAGGAMTSGGKADLTNLTIDPKRLWDSLMETARFGATEKGGIRRLTLSDEDRQVRDWFKRACEAIGCTVTVDDCGNMFRAAPASATTCRRSAWALISIRSRPAASSTASWASSARWRSCGRCMRAATTPTHPSKS